MLGAGGGGALLVEGAEGRASEGVSLRLGGRGRAFVLNPVVSTRYGRGGGLSSASSVSCCLVLYRLCRAASFALTAGLAGVVIPELSDVVGGGGATAPRFGGGAKVAGSLSEDNGVD